MNAFSLPSFIAGRGPAYLWTSALKWYVTVQCASPGRGEELVSACVNVHAVLHMAPECFDHWATWAG